VGVLQIEIKLPRTKKQDHRTTPEQAQDKHRIQQGSSNLLSTYQQQRSKKMAKVKYNPVLMQIQGKIKGLIFRLSHSGKTTVYAAPDMSRVRWSKAQKGQRAKFRTANLYAQKAMDIPQLRLYYQDMAAKKNSKQPYNMAVSDYHHGDDTHNTLLQLYRQQEGADWIWITEKSLRFPPSTQQATDDFCI
jgi:hypothetical protein